MSSAEVRLNMFSSLPETHRQYFFGELQNLCREFLRNNRRRFPEIDPPALLSEVWGKLLGGVALDESERKWEGALTIADPEPTKDGRVTWLLNEIGGAQALGHRCSDIARTKYGRGPGGKGPRFVQMPDRHEIIHDGDDDSARTFAATDSVHVWRGLQLTASAQFEAADDVTLLLNVLADDPALLEDSANGRWPMNEIAVQLNRRIPLSSWNATRVENAKRRLQNWIVRLQRQNGLDRTDLEALFARVARKGESAERSRQPSRRDIPNLLN